MNLSPDIFLGIDPTAGRHPYTWAALDADFQLIALAGGELDEVVDYVDGFSSALVAVNAPVRPNLGLVRQKLAGERSALHLRGADMRMAEHLLRERGISVPPTASRAETCAAWIQMGFALHRRLDEIGFLLDPEDGAPRRRLETNPHAVFCALLGQVPLPKPSLEGRLQRQLALHGLGMGIADPMDFFEEITRHRLLRGILPMEFIHTPEELDALAAALTAWYAVNRADEFMFVGERGEGQIALPVRDLKERYT